MPAVLSRLPRMAPLEVNISRFLRCSCGQSSRIGQLHSRSRKNSNMLAGMCSVSSQGLLSFDDFVMQQLYGKGGYFHQQGHTSPVGSVDENVDFRSFSGEQEYKIWLQNRYQSLENSWLTPSILFQPYYGRSFANWAMAEIQRWSHAKLQAKQSQTSFKQHKERLPCINIIEIGGGDGSFAKSFLDFFKQNSKSLYSKIHYCSVEISPELCTRQELKVKAVHDTKFVVVNDDFMSIQPTALPRTATQEALTFVFAMEILDNTPHEKITVGHDGSIERCFFTASGDQVGLPLDVSTNSYVQRLVDIIQPLPPRSFLPFAKPKARDVYLPTGAMKLLDKVQQLFPGAALALADFHHLDDCLQGTYAPVLQLRQQSVTTILRDIQSIPAQKHNGRVDIMFPTDFSLLAKIDMHARERKGQAYRHSQWLAKWGEPAKTRTKSGYNPLLEDYTYQSVYASPLVEVPESSG